MWAHVLASPMTGSRARAFWLASGPRPRRPLTNPSWPTFCGWWPRGSAFAQAALRQQPRPRRPCHKATAAIGIQCHVTRHGHRRPARGQARWLAAQVAVTEPARIDTSQPGCPLHAASERSQPALRTLGNRGMQCPGAAQSRSAAEDVRPRAAAISSLMMGSHHSSYYVTLRSGETPPYLPSGIDRRVCAAEGKAEVGGQAVWRGAGESSFAQGAGEGGAAAGWRGQQ